MILKTRRFVLKFLVRLKVCLFTLQFTPGQSTNPYLVYIHKSTCTRSHMMDLKKVNLLNNCYLLEITSESKINKLIYLHECVKSFTSTHSCGHQIRAKAKHSMVIKNKGNLHWSKIYEKEGKRCVWFLQIGPIKFWHKSG